MKSQKINLYKILVMSLVMMTAFPIIAKADYWRGAVSEETIPATCDLGDLAVGAFCSGSYCDNTWLLCRDTNLTSTSNRSWKPFVSEEGNNIRTCGNGYITGLAANGSYGDNISIECSSFTGKAPTNCAWTTAVSEEQGRLDFMDGKFAVAVQCTGAYCDNKRFLVCS